MSPPSAGMQVPPLQGSSRQGSPAEKIFIYDESEETLIRTLTSLRTLKESQSATHGKFWLNSELDVTTRQSSL